MNKNTATDVGALIEKIEKDMAGLDIKTASSAQLAGLVEDFKVVETAMAETDEPMLKMLAGLLGVGGKEIQAAYEAAQVREGLIPAPVTSPSNTANQPTIEELKQRIEQLDAKIQSLRNMSDDDITPQLLKEVVEEGRALKKDIDATNNPLAQFLGSLLESEALSVLEVIYEEMLNDTPNPESEAFLQRMEQLEKKMQSVSNISKDDISPEVLKEIIEEGRALKKDIDATSFKVLAQFMGDLFKSEQWLVLEEMYKKTVSDAASVFAVANEDPQPTLFEVRKIFTKLQAKVKKIVAKGDTATSEETNEVVDLAKVLNTYAQANPSEKLSGIFTKYLQGIKIKEIQAFVPQPQFITEAQSVELLTDLKNAMMVLDGQKKEDTRRQDVLTLIEQYKKVKNAIDHATFESNDNKKALQEIIDGVTLKDFEEIHDEVVRLEAAKHPDFERFIQLQEDLKQFETKVNELKAKRATSTSTLQDFQEVIQLGDQLKEYADTHPSRIATMTHELLENSGYNDLKKAYAESSTQKTFVNGKFDLFEEGFVGTCQKYFEDLAVNYSKKSKKYLQEAAQVMKGLPEDFKGLKAESAEEKEFIDNLPGQTTLLAKIIDRELKLREKAAVKKAQQKETKEVPSVAKKAKTTSAKKTETTKATKKRVKV